MTSKSNELRDLVSKIPSSVENSQAFIVPDLIGSLSNKDRARIIYALGMSNYRLMKQLAVLSAFLRDLTCPVDEQ